MFCVGPRTLQRFYRRTSQREDEKERLQRDDEQGKQTLLVLKIQILILVQCSCVRTLVHYTVPASY